MGITSISGVLFENISKINGKEKNSISKINGKNKNSYDFVTNNLIGWYDPSLQIVGDTYLTDQSYVVGLTNQDHSMVGKNGSTLVSVGDTIAAYTDGVNDQFYTELITPSTSDQYYVPNLTNYTNEIWFRSDGRFNRNGALWNAGLDSGTWCYFSNRGSFSIYPGTTFDSGFNASTDTWYHLLITLETTSQSVLKVYVNGVLSYTSSSFSYNPSWESTPWFLGSYNSKSSFGKFYYGVIRRYNKALSSDEVVQNYNVEKSRYGY